MVGHLSKDIFMMGPQSLKRHIYDGSSLKRHIMMGHLSKDIFMMGHLSKDIFMVGHLSKGSYCSAEVLLSSSRILRRCKVAFHCIH